MTTCANCREQQPIVKTFSDPARGYCEGCWNPFGEILGDEA